MDSVAAAALASWNIRPFVTGLLLLLAVVYCRGWLRGRRLLHDEKDYGRLAAFLAAMVCLFLALESPLDALDGLFLSAHMTQHLLLMTIAPALVLLSHPVLPLLRGLPKQFVKEGLGPFLAWPALQRVGHFLVTPVFAWVAFAVSTIGWHLPSAYELALSSPAWHGAQHASFFWTGILFWWPVVQPGPGRAKGPQWLQIPYLVSADIVNTIIAASFVFSGKLLYPSYEARAGGMNPMTDQILAGAIMWVPGSVLYLVPTVVFAMNLLSTRRRRSTTSVPVRQARKSGGKFSISGRRLAQWRRAAQFGMLLLAAAVMADGFFGPQVTPLNLAGVLPWIHWRALSILALLVVGNLFCMVCPFTFVRDVFRRMMSRLMLPARRRWPRVLRTKWLAAGLLLVYLWAYEAFSLWNSPWATAWIVAGYFLGALIIDGLFRGASFCKYVCPIGQFHFVISLVSPREVRVRSAAVCQSCQTHDCIRGNASARGCELYLFQPKKVSNLDCTFCLDCVRACPHENVSLLPVLPASTLTVDPYRSSIGRLSKRTDFAVLVLLVVFGAFVNAAGMVGPVMMWEHRWHARLGARMMPAVVAAFVIAGAVILPAVAVSLCAGLNRLLGSMVNVRQTVRRFVFALAPLGIAMWAAHLLYHFASGWNAPSAALERLLAGMTGTAPMAFNPDWIISAQIALLDAGLLLTMYVGWRVARQQVDGWRRAMGLAAPWMAVSCGLYCAGVWILFQPMQMRGMMH